MTTQLERVERAPDSSDFGPRRPIPDPPSQASAPERSAHRRSIPSVEPSAAVGPPVSHGVTPSIPSLGPDRGLGLLYWFVFATAVMVGAFFAAGAVARMWILIPGMAVHLLMTFFVLRAIAGLMTRGNDE